MNLLEAKQFIAQQLLSIYDADESANIAGLAIEHITGLTRTQQLAQKNQELTAGQVQHLHQNLQRLLNNEPVQYLMNKAWFYGMELYVDKSVLIPRPETEELVKWIVDDQRLQHPDLFRKAPFKADETKTLKILDIGTGSGCIALALKKSIPPAEVWGCDVSEEALTVARRNGSALDIRVDFQGIDFLDESSHVLLPAVHIIVSNPPYVPLKDKAAMRSNVLNFEPHKALFVSNDDPLLFYKAIAQFGKKRLDEDGSVYLEIHEDLGDEVLHLFKSNGYTKVELRKDLQGKNRMVKASHPGSL